MSNTRIPEEKISEIRAAVDIVDIISEYVQLKKQGRNYFGLCPFHGEKSPSFSVSPDKQIFHCFGCGAGGNSFTFVMDIEGISFIEAAKKVADRANITLDIDMQNVGEKRQSPIESSMVEAHDLLRKFYHHLLVNTKEGQDALEYLQGRGFTEEAINKFQIGYALDSWDLVYKFLIKRGFSEDLLEKSGLIIKSDKTNSYFDRFRNRIMFPITDHQGNTVAFSGRAMGDDNPKYLNSPETAIFNKSRILYNFQKARPSIRKKEQVILFEGFADCISASTAGVDNGVATMGTALTDHHIQLLRRNTDTAVICFDSDSAGLEAANRAAGLLIDSGFTIKVALMPDNMDPDDYIKKHGADKFLHEVIGASLTYTSFKMQFLRRGKNVNNEGDRIQYLEAVLKEISKLSNAVERDHYLRQIASEFSLSLDALEKQLKQIYFAGNKKGNAAPRTDRPVTLQYEKKLKPAHHNAERTLIAHMLKHKDIAFKIQDLMDGHFFNLDEHQEIITYLYAFYEEGHESDTSRFLSFLADVNLRKIVSDIEMMTINDEFSDQEIRDCVNQVLKYQKMLMIKEKEAERKKAELQKDHLKAAKIAMEIIQLTKLL
ncbi:DNA primase [Peribacillus deserti]|uniref:DNA primase n=1 Tax=Peribacillus deserti TaxID=673318 RepID=A0ABS2QF68_9BACI|nr:DNA primase [Peribacillus deserti]MBM7691791.1 DNA primase [Peribacillus deserti]